MTRARACTGQQVPLGPVPADPDSGQVQAARDFLLTTFLATSVVSAADRPTTSACSSPDPAQLPAHPDPVSRSDLHHARVRKTILTCGLGMLYGQRVLTWTHSDEELRSHHLGPGRPGRTIIFDNLAEGTAIDSLRAGPADHDRTWADRILGKNVTAAFANDRVWTATGNNLRLGGDMRTRSVLVSSTRTCPGPRSAPASRSRTSTSGSSSRQPAPGALAPPGPGRRLDRSGAPRRPGLTMRQFTPG